MPKDACYHKVKSRYRVFPSAYASGAIAKCRKVGAANYGKSTKKKATGGVVKMKKGGEAKKNKNVIEKYGDTAINTLTGMALGAGAYGANLARTARSKAKKAAKLRFDNYIADLDKKRVKKSLKNKSKPSSGGGVGGFGKFSTIGRTKNMAKDMPDMKFFSKGGFIAKGCGQVENSRRKRTRNF